MTDHASKVDPALPGSASEEINWKIKLAENLEQSANEPNTVQEPFGNCTVNLRPTTLRYLAKCLRDQAALATPSSGQPYQVAKIGHGETLLEAMEDARETTPSALPSERAAEIKEIDEALVAIAEGYSVQGADGYIIVANPDATEERIALAGVNPNLVIDVARLRSILCKHQATALPPSERERVVKVMQTAEAFRMAMIETGALNNLHQSKYFVQLRALENALYAARSLASDLRGKGEGK